MARHEASASWRSTEMLGIGIGLPLGTVFGASGGGVQRIIVLAIIGQSNEAGTNDGTGISAADIAPDARIVQWPSAAAVPGTPGGDLVPAAEPLMFPGTRSNAAAVGYAMPMAKAVLGAESPDLIVIGPLAVGGTS